MDGWCDHLAFVENPGKWRIPRHVFAVLFEHNGHFCPIQIEVCAHLPDYPQSNQNYLGSDQQATLWEQATPRLPLRPPEAIGLCTLIHTNNASRLAD